MRALPIETLDFINAMAFFSTEHVGWDRHFWLDQGFELKEIRMSHPSLPLYYSHITKFHQSLEGTLYYGLSNYQEVKLSIDVKDIGWSFLQALSSPVTHQPHTYENMHSIRHTFTFASRHTCYPGSFCDRSHLTRRDFLGSGRVWAVFYCLLPPGPVGR